MRINVEEMSDDKWAIIWPYLIQNLLPVARQRLAHWIVHSVRDMEVTSFGIILRRSDFIKENNLRIINNGSSEISYMENPEIDSPIEIDKDSTIEQIKDKLKRN